MKSEDLLSSEQIRSKLAEASADLRFTASADAAALIEEGQDSFEADAYDELADANPAVPSFLSRDQYHGLGGASLDVGSTRYEVAFNDARRRLLGQVAHGADHFIAVVLQEAVNTIDELRNLSNEIATEAAQLSAAASAGLLVPVSPLDMEDYRDEVEEASRQANLLHREIGNVRARRRASRTAEGGHADDLFPSVRSIPGRNFAQMPAASEEDDRIDQGVSLVSGRAGQSRASVAVSQADLLQEMLRAPLLSRMHYVAICAALAGLSRTKRARARAQRSIEKLKRIYASIKEILSGSFLKELQANLEKGAERSAARALDFLQMKLDSIDQFMKVQTGFGGLFVSTVRAIGEVPDTTPVINSLASLCGLKGARFCDLQGLLEIARSIDVELGLEVPRPPMIGRAVLSLDAADQTQAPEHETTPGQEADLILVSTANGEITARFSRADAEAQFGPGGFRERPNMFGDGPGRIVLLGDGSREDEEFEYVSASFDEITNNYTFSGVTPVVPGRVPVVRGEADNATLPGWNDSTLFEVGESEITLRVPEAQMRDISLPCDLALGFGEQETFTGTYDASTPNEIVVFEDLFEEWMVGMWIELGPASGDGVAARRKIDSFIDERTVTYEGSHVPPHLSGDFAGRGAFRFSVDRYEVTRATAVAPGPHTDLKVFTCAPLSRPHGRLRAIPQQAVRVVPHVRDTYLDPTLSPADPRVRATNVLPPGSNVVRATYVDLGQDAYFTPILTAAGVGKIYLNGDGPFAYVAVTDEGGGQLRFTLSSPTTRGYAVGTIVEVETTSLLDRFSVDFPDEWFEPFDLWLLNLGGELNKLEAKLCRLMSGSSQDVASSAAALSTLAGSVSLTLTTARFLFVAWLIPLIQRDSVSSILDELGAIGATRAERQLREGRISEFASMDPAEGTDAGAAMVAAQAYRERVGTDEQYRLLSKAVAELNGRYESLAVAASTTGDIKLAQKAELDRRQEAARRLEALQEKL